MKDTYAVWLVALELLLGDVLALGKMIPRELAIYASHGHDNCHREEKEVFRLLIRYFNCEEEVNEVPTLKQLYCALGGEEPDFNDGL